MVLLQIVALLLVAVAMGLSLAHALEFPGKKRLDRETYAAVQEIYYPGFTLGGLVGELGGLVLLALLLALLAPDAPAFAWTAAALALLGASHLTYWLVTHRVNLFWVKDLDLGGAGARFFGLGGRRIQGDWTRLRDIWEYSHAARGGLALLALAACAAALAA